MTPQVAAYQEVKLVREQFERIRAQVETREGVKLDVKFGTMIETVRATLDADEIAKYAEFFSFGTNDLSQATFSFSREDAEAKFLPFYLEKGVLAGQPVRDAGREGRRQADPDGRRVGQEDEAGPRGRDMRRARGRPALDLSLPQGRARTTSQRRRSGSPSQGSRPRGSPFWTRRRTEHDFSALYRLRGRAVDEVQDRARAGLGVRGEGRESDAGRRAHP